MILNYTKTLLILIVAQCGLRAIVGSAADKMAGVAILLFIFGTPIALFADWRSYRKDLQAAQVHHPKPPQCHIEAVTAKQSILP